MRAKAGMFGALLTMLYAVLYLTYRFIDFGAIECWSVCILLLACVYYRLTDKRRSKEVLIGDKAAWVMAVFLSVTLVTGFYFDDNQPFELMKAKDVVNYLLCVAGLVPLSRCFFVVICEFIERWTEGEKHKIIGKRNSVKDFLLAFIIIFVCWIPVWMAYYPGLWNYDPWQVNQFMGGHYNKFHPLIHTRLLGKCYYQGIKMGNENMGVVLYDLIQMSIMAGIFAYTYVYLCKHISGRCFRGMVIVFYAVFPVNSILAISTTKDVIFSGLVLLCLVFSMQVKETVVKRQRVIRLLLLMAACVYMMLFRNNAVYAFCLFAIGALTIPESRKNKFLIGFYMVCCLLIFKTTDIVLTQRLNASEGNIREVFSVTSQQFGRINEVISSSGTDQETLDIINRYYDKTQFAYEPHNADSMKINLYLDSGTVADYISASIKLFCKYPVISLDSFLYVTEGGWNINDTSHASIYGSGLEDRQGYLLTDVKDGYRIVHESRLPKLESFLEHAFSNNEYQDWPIISLLFSPALYVWILLLCTLVFIKMKNRYFLVITSFLWFLLLTVLAGPCVVIRYYYPLVVCSPVLMSMVNNSIKEQRTV